MMVVVIALVGLMLLTWGMAVWASIATEPARSGHGTTEQARRAA